MALSMSSGRDPTARLRAGLNPLLTASLGFPHQNQNNLNTPLSAVSMASGAHSHSSSQHPYSSLQTPVSAVQPYNPQQWISSPVPGHTERFQAYEAPQPSPPPPPPYSPPRSQRPLSMSLDPQQVANISAVRAPPPPPSIQQRRSSETHTPPMTNTTFAPPPGIGARGASRERRFGLPSFGRRRELEQTQTPPSPESFSHVHSHSMSQPSQPHPLSVSTRPQAAPAPLTLNIPTRSDSDSSQSLPPGARRAVSTPAAGTPISARSRSSSQVRWDAHQGPLVLPPPPPGPPPASSRSQSVTRAGENGAPVMSPPTRRPPPSGVTALGPVPPTPANWMEEADPPRTQSPASTSMDREPESAVSISASQASSAGGLARARAVRGEKTLLQRRSESRTRHGVHDSIDASLGAQPLSEIVIPSSSGGLSRRLTISRGTPRSSGFGESNRSAGIDTPQTGDTSVSSEVSTEASNSTPRALSSAASSQISPETPTFSPQPQRPRATPEPHHTIAPKALPTPPPQSRSSSRGPFQLVETITPGPKSPTRPLTRQIVVKQTVEQFSRATIERFEAFAQREANAADDADRVRLFAEFFVNESRIRRERYSGAISAMGSEIFDLTRDLFRPMTVTRRDPVMASPGPSSADSRSQRVSTPTVASAPSSSAPSSAKDNVIMSSPASSSSATSTPGNGNWQSGNFMPSLSPILSMSASSALDEEDSRGRPASRWWEGESTGAASAKLERTKRESKYMGVPKEAREALQYMEDPVVQTEAGSSTQPAYAADSYPPEKVGWHEPDDGQHQQTPQKAVTTSSSTPMASLTANPTIRNSLLSPLSLTLSSPNTPNPAHLDCSRLVTLPPPYPRHHPAVNNSHPELAQIREAVRAISDMAPIATTKQTFLTASTALRKEASSAAQQRTASLRSRLQQEISSGRISYAEAAALEAESRTTENAAAKELEKKDFESFQTVVVMPLNDLLTSRIATATSLLDDLRCRLFTSDPNMPQEEGDEQPELLEKLTLLKWIFEAREALHRAIYDLLTDRNDRYREMVLTPYRLANNADKIASATAFFAEDAVKRSLAFAQEVFARTQEFRDVVEETVLRGVEAQLGAFWDIAPPLKRLLDKIPLELDGSFGIQIPVSEYEENPAYHEHPMQYLFSLLLHAEKSTYQFIESQTNLLCLLHEVREAVVVARGKVMENEGVGGEAVEEMRRGEMARLTDDLKEKVRIVQEQWNDALGEGIKGCKERVGEWLLETGGWDESLEDTGVGVSLP